MTIKERVAEVAALRTHIVMSIPGDVDGMVASMALASALGEGLGVLPFATAQDRERVVDALCQVVRQCALGVHH